VNTQNPQDTKQSTRFGGPGTEIPRNEMRFRRKRPVVLAHLKERTILPFLRPIIVNASAADILNPDN